MAIDPNAFYTTSAAVLPVFYLTLAFEQNQSAFFSDEVASAFASPNSVGVRVFRAGYSLWVTLSIACGEAAAFVGMATDAPLRFEFGWLGQVVAWGLAIGGLGVVAPLVVLQVDQLWRALAVTDDMKKLTLIRVAVIMMTLGFVVYLVSFLIWALIH